MSRPALLTRWATILALLAVSAAALADEPPPRPAPSGSTPGSDDVCEDAVRAWAKGASGRAGLTITAARCPVGVVRLEVAGAGCDYEVSREGGFQRTADGAFGVSPIANLDWNKAPESMKKGLAAIVSALAQDPSLPIRAGSALRHPDRGSKLLGSRRNQLFAGAGGAVVVSAAAFALWRRRRKARPAAS